MATANLNLLPFPATALRPSSAAGHRLPSRKISASASRSNNWWTPLFGWSPEPDYIESEDAGTKSAAPARFTPGCFTAEKAKQLRMMTKETASFHDVMYHSAIASRLALDSINQRSES